MQEDTSQSPGEIGTGVGLGVTQLHHTSHPSFESLRVEAETLPTAGAAEQSRELACQEVLVIEGNAVDEGQVGQVADRLVGGGPAFGPGGSSRKAQA
jgi:hypothetical protein